MNHNILYFEMSSGTYAYNMYGKGNPIVLLHGFTGTQKTWDFAIKLLEKNFKVITIDLPGHGETMTSSPRSMEACVKDLYLLFKHLQIKHFNLVGYSMGGRTALAFALTYPQMILSLVLESASPGLKTFSERVERIKADEEIAQIIGSMGMTSFVDYWENIALFSTQKNLSISQQVTIRNERLNQSELGLAESLRLMGTGSQPSYWNKLSKFTPAVLLIVGDKDAKFVKINVEMESHFDDATLYCADGAGHAVHIEKPEIFLRQISNFISKDKCNKNE